MIAAHFRLAKSPDWLYAKNRLDYCAETTSFRLRNRPVALQGMNPGAGWLCEVAAQGG